MNEAELLFCEIFNCSRLSLYLDASLNLDKVKSASIARALERRIEGEPMQYILGKSEFMGLEFKVTADVLIPRQETEILVEKTLEYVTRHTSHVTRQKILDLGTGSGNIAVSLAKLLPESEVTATDISEKALAVALDNARFHNVAERIQFIKSNLFPCELRAAACYDIIVSNPPYIPSRQIGNLQPEVQWESRIALDGGEDGLEFYRKIIEDSPQYLKNGGYLILEIGFDQRSALENIFKKSENFEIIEVVKDYNNIERVVSARKL